jgi:hypothetical protein
MQNRLVIFILLILCLTICYGQDLKRKNQYIISTYPSNLLVGDASIGFEHCYKKRWSQEAMVFVKCFSPDYSNYKYDQGMRINYFLKYNFINRKRIRISGNLSYSYKHMYFNNKPDALFRNFAETPDQAQAPPLFSMSRSLEGYGPGAGFTFNYNIANHLGIGSDMQFEYLNYQRYFIVNDPEKIYEYYPGYLYLRPEYFPATTYRSPFRYRLSFFATLKISYRF